MFKLSEIVSYNEASKKVINDVEYVLYGCDVCGVSYIKTDEDTYYCPRCGSNHIHGYTKEEPQPVVTEEEVLVTEEEVVMTSEEARASLINTRGEQVYSLLAFINKRIKDAIECGNNSIKVYINNYNESIVLDTLVVLEEKGYTIEKYRWDEYGKFGAIIITF